MSYSGDPSASTLDEIRFLIGDTSNDGHERLSDEEITYVITKLGPTYTDALMYAAYCADRIADLFAGEVSISADGVSISTDQLQDKYRTMAQRLREEYARLHGVGAAPFAGGSSLWDDYLDWDVKPRTFAVAMNDNRMAGRQGLSSNRHDDEDC
jgi:hypothetical protein